MVDTYFLHRLSEDVHILINVLCDVTTTYFVAKKQNQQRQIQILSNSSLVNHSFSLSLSFAVLYYDVLFFLMMFDNIPVYFIYSYIYICSHWWWLRWLLAENIVSSYLFHRFDWLINFHMRVCFAIAAYCLIFIDIS